jgi:hypothetical protein
VIKQYSYSHSQQQVLLSMEQVHNFTGCFISLEDASALSARLMTDTLSLTGLLGQFVTQKNCLSSFTKQFPVMPPEVSATVSNFFIYQSEEFWNCLIQLRKQMVGIAKRCERRAESIQMYTNLDCLDLDPLEEEELLLIYTSKAWIDVASKLDALDVNTCTQKDLDDIREYIVQASELSTKTAAKIEATIERRRSSEPYPKKRAYDEWFVPTSEPSIKTAVKMEAAIKQGVDEPARKKCKLCA